MQNLFANPAFNMASLTAAINLVPNRYGRLEDLNLFPAKPTRFRQIIIEERNGVLNLLPTLPPGSPGTVGTRGKRKVRSFVIPHIPHDDVVLPEEVQGIRAFGSETELETLAGVLARHLETMRNKHAITLAMASISVSEPKARMPWTSSGSTTSSCGMWGMTKERSLRVPRSPTVPGEPGGLVGSRLSLPAYSSTMFWRVRTGLAGNRFKASRRP